MVVLSTVVEDLRTASAFVAWVFDQNFIANLGDIDCYQHRAGGVESEVVMVGLSGMGCEHSHSRETPTGQGRLQRCAPAAKSCAHRGLGRRRSFIPQVLWQRVHLERPSSLGADQNRVEWHYIANSPFFSFGGFFHSVLPVRSRPPSGSCCCIGSFRLLDSGSFFGALGRDVVVEGGAASGMAGRKAGTQLDRS